MRRKSPLPDEAITRLVGQRIRLRRVMQGYNRKDLAQKLGVSYQQIQKYETGDNRIGASSLWQIARELEVTPGYFLQNIEETEALNLPSTRLAALLAGELDRLASRRLYLCALHLIRLIIGVVTKKGTAQTTTPTCTDVIKNQSVIN